MNVRILIVLVAAAAIAVAAGCGAEANGGSDTGGGGSGGKEVPRGVSLSRPEFIEEASKACREARSGIDEAVSRFMAGQSPAKPRPVLYADLAHLILLPMIEAELESIRLLGVPPSEEAHIEEILDEGEYTINLVVYESRIPSRSAIYRKLAGVDRMFRKYGLPACVSKAALTGGNG